MRASGVRGSLTPSLRRQAEGIEALLAVIEWADNERAALTLGIGRRALVARLGHLYALLRVDDRTQATMAVWALIRDSVVLRDDHGTILPPRRRRWDVAV